MIARSFALLLHESMIYTSNWDLYVGRQSDDDGQNKFTQINERNEILSYIINRVNLIQLEEIKTEAFY